MTGNIRLPYTPKLKLVSDRFYMIWYIQLGPTKSEITIAGQENA